MNTAHQREQWDREDVELAEEFEDVTSAWRQSRGKPPHPPHSLDQQIKAQAGYQAGESLTQSWMLGQGPQLVLVICLLFGIGLFFVASLKDAQQNPGTGSTGWIRLEFRVDDSGKAQNVEIINRCVRPAKNSQCLANDTSLDQRAIEAVKDRQYPGTGKQQDVVNF